LSFILCHCEYDNHHPSVFDRFGLEQADRFAPESPLKELNQSFHFILMKYRFFYSQGNQNDYLSIP